MKKNNNIAYTLIEVIVSVTIFSIIMISVVSIYIISNDTSIKSDINRSMQENLKSIITEIGEDIINNGISGVSNNMLTEGCDLDYGNSNYKKGSTLCLGSLNNYYLAKKNIATGNYDKVDASSCKGINDQCFLAKSGIGLSSGEPLTNTLVTIKNLDYFVTTSYGINKVTILIELQPSGKGGVKPDLIENNKMLFQTTISERPLLTK